MGYDFSFVRLAPRPDAFPFQAPSEFDGSLESFQDAAAIESHLLSSAGFRPNGAPFNGVQWYRLDTEDGGSLGVRVGTDWVSVDTHAHWD